MRIDAAQIGGDQGIGDQVAGNGGCAGGGGELPAELAQVAGLNKVHMIHDTVSGARRQTKQKMFWRRRGILI